MEKKEAAYLLVCIYSVVTCFVLFCLLYETHHDVSQAYPSSRRFTINGVIKVVNNLSSEDDILTHFHHEEKLNEGGDGDVVLIPEDGDDDAGIPEEEEEEEERDDYDDDDDVIQEDGDEDDVIPKDGDEDDDVRSEEENGDEDYLMSENGGDDDDDDDVATSEYEVDEDEDNGEEKDVGAGGAPGETDKAEGVMTDEGGGGAGGEPSEGREDDVIPHGESVDDVASGVKVRTQSVHDRPPSSPANLSSTGYLILDTKQPFTKRCRRCALVSSGGHLYRSGAGAEIDSADCVLRMNTAPVNGWSSDVGLRTDIRIIGHVNIPRGLVKRRSLRNEILSNSTTRTSYIVVPWLKKEKVNMKTNKIVNQARQFKRMYPEVDFVFLTSKKYSQSEARYKKETGYSRAAMRTKFSTGFVSMMFALDICDEVLVYGISRDDFCKKNPKSKVPYHYYEPRKKSECYYVKKLEMNSHTGHKFLTEHAMFARWSTVRNITFRYPSWKGSKASKRVGSYFLKKYKNTLGKNTRRL